MVQPNLHNGLTEHPTYIRRDLGEHLSEYRIHRNRTSANCWKVDLTTDCEEVSRLWIFIKTMRIGSVGVRIGGIGGVGTNRDHRHKGFASLSMHESTALMADKNCDMGFLFGIQDFYDSFGYAVCFSDSMIHVNTKDLRLARSGLITRAYRKSDARQVRRIYNQANGACSASVVRPPSWDRFEMAADFKSQGKAIVALDAAGRIVGYAAFRIEDQRCTVHEISGRNNDARNALSATLARRAHRAECDKVVFHVPADGPFADYCTRYGYRSECHHPRNAGPMARIIRLKPLFKKIVPELNLRLRNHPALLNGALTIETGIGSVALSVQNSSVRLNNGPQGIQVRIPQLILTQLILGYRSVSDISTDGDVNIPSNCRSLLQILFPKHKAYMWWSDRF